MQLISLRIKNLNSLKGEHTIDFLKGALAQTGLFAITGPTGAGKSTILDAITLALYNQTPRNGSVSTNSIAQLGSIITRNTDEAWAQLDYQIKNKVYRSHWGISRNRNGKLREYTLVLSEQNEANDFVPYGFKKGEVPKENTRLIGLSFDQFLRSILLSQGDFARFLKSNANERGELLEKITGTEIYRTIGQRAYYRQKDEWVKLDKLKQQLEGIELLSDEERAQIETELTQHIADSKSIDEQLNLLRVQQKVRLENKQIDLDIVEKQQQTTELKIEQAQFDPMQKQLRRHQQLLPFKSDVFAVQSIEKGRADKLKEQSDNLVRQNKLAEGKQKLEVSFVKCQDEIKLLIDSESKLAPIVKEVREIDSHIKIRQSRYQELEQRFEADEKDIKQVQDSITTQKQNLGTGEAEVERLRKYLQEAHLLSGLNEQLPALKLKSSTLYAAHLEFDDKLRQMDESQTKKSLLLISDPEKQHELLAGALQKSEEYLKTQVVDLKVNKEQKEELVKQKDDFQHLVRVLEKVIEQQTHKNELTDELKSLNVCLKETSLVQKNNADELATVEKAIELNHKYLEELQIRRERELLEAKYEDARLLLKVDEACPLCGSKDHPYVEQYEQKGNETEQLLSSKSAQQQKLDSKKLKIVEEASKLNSECQAITKQVVQLSENIQVKGTSIQLLLDENKIELVSDKVEEVNRLKSDKQEKAFYFDRQLKLLENIEKARMLNKEFKDLSVVLNTLRNTRDELKQELLPYAQFLTSEKFDEQIVALENQYKDFKAKQDQFQRLDTELVKHKATLEEKNNQLKQMATALSGSKELLKDAKKEWEDEKEKRHAIFGDKSPDDEVRKLLVEKESLDKSNQAIELELKEVVTSIKSLETRAKDLARLIEQDNAQLKVQQENLLQRLKSYSIASMDEVLNHLLTEEESKRIQEQDDKLRTRAVELKQSLKELQERQLKLKPEMDLIKWSEAELASLIDQRSDELKLHIGKAGSLKEKLAQDDRNKSKQADKVKVILSQEKEFNRWNALSALIGDAQGNKFAKYAQELTLQQVMHLANSHLRHLADRYLLKHIKTDTIDDLFVVDTYHGNAERSVKTLSGGESFLVSLSLALGLSDLAGQNTVIGSLFIDEGFGTLDQNTLDVALSALEKLQNETNRTIGIISHVPALKERVTTQIELIKNASGYSTLEIKS